MGGANIAIYEFAVHHVSKSHNYTVHKDNNYDNHCPFFHFYEAQLAAAALCIHAQLLLVWLTKMQLHNVSVLRTAFACVSNFIGGGGGGGARPPSRNN